MIIWSTTKQNFNANLWRTQFLWSDKLENHRNKVDKSPKISIWIRIRFHSPIYTCLMYPISEKTKWPTVSSAIFGGISHLGVEFKPKLLQGVTKKKVVTRYVSIAVVLFIFFLIYFVGLIQNNCHMKSIWVACMLYLISSVTNTKLNV